MLFIAFWLWLFSRLVPRSRKASRGRPFVPGALPALRTRKPDWVIDEVVRLKALMSDAGCRRIADTFNRLHLARHAMTVSKSWVATAIRKYRLEIEERRREWKRRIPPPIEAAGGRIAFDWKLISCCLRGVPSKRPMSSVVEKRFLVTRLLRRLPISYFDG